MTKFFHDQVKFDFGRENPLTIKDSFYSRQVSINPFNETVINGRLLENTVQHLLLDENNNNNNKIILIVIENLLE